jgi:hypothetical protein
VHVHRITAMLVVCAVSQACSLGPRHVRHGFRDDVVHEHSIELKGSIALELPDGSSQSSPIQLRLRTESHVARVFSDSTLGLLVRIADVEGQLGEGNEVEALPRADLVGKSLAVRALPSGEIFRMIGTESLSGPDRRGLFWTDALLALAHRLPASPWVGDGGPEYRYSRSIPVTGLAEVQQSWRLTYTRAEIVDCEGETCYRFQYEASVTERGSDPSAERPARLHGEGRSEGWILWRRSDAIVLEHEYVWSTERKVDLLDAEGEVLNRVVNRLGAEVRLAHRAARRTSR